MFYLLKNYEVPFKILINKSKLSIMIEHNAEKYARVDYFQYSRLELFISLSADCIPNAKWRHRVADTRNEYKMRGLSHFSPKGTNILHRTHYGCVHSNVVDSLISKKSKFDLFRLIYYVIMILF